MRHLLLGLVVSGVVTNCGLPSAFAQQRPRPVLIVFRQTSVAKTQFSPDAAGLTNGGGSNSAGPTDNSAPGTLPPSAATPTTSATSSQSTSANSDDAIDYSQRPTFQQMQNPGGAYQMTHTGFTQNQYTSPNNYFGSQFNTWSNLRPVPTNLDLFESFNRTQPPLNANSGAYFSGNSYLGPVNNQWSNLSSGSITPNYLGSYIYQP